jgi:23S rRNA (uridine2552-2'-O)-methyltransferase
MPIPHVRSVQGDLVSAETVGTIEALLASRKADAVVSDMAPNMSGEHIADHSRSMVGAL